MRGKRLNTCSIGIIRSVRTSDWSSFVPRLIFSTVSFNSGCPTSSASRSRRPRSIMNSSNKFIKRSIRSKLTRIVFAWATACSFGSSASTFGFASATATVSALTATSGSLDALVYTVTRTCSTSDTWDTACSITSAVSCDTNKTSNERSNCSCSMASVSGNVRTTSPSSCRRSNTI